MVDRNQIYWGILGAGDVAEIKSGPAFSKIQNSELIAVMRRNKDKAKDFANRHGVSKWYHDADQLLNDTSINAIYISTPPKFHKDYAIKALKAGKHVYLEKPMALNMKESQDIALVQRELNVKLCIAHYRRALDAFIFVKKLLSDNAIGQVRFARISIFQPHASSIIAQTESNWRTDPKISGGGLFHDLAPHQIDLMINWFGYPTAITGFSANRSGNDKADDLVMGEFTCQNKVVVQGAWCFSVAASQAKDSCEIYGSEGQISFSFFGDKVLWQNQEGIFEQTFSHPENIQLPMIQQAVNYFQNEAENPCSANDAIEVMRVMDRFTGLG